MSVRVACPSCGGPVVFEVGSSMVAVCPYCRSAVARGDRNIEDLGKVAALVDTGAILRVGLQGRYDGRKFQLTGRVQLAHQAGGLWDEWYASFDGNRWGWLSEAQGRFYILFEQPPGDTRPILDDIEPGDEVPLPESDARFVVAETGMATAQGAEGEIPYRFEPGSTYHYADLSGTDRAFATLDYSEAPPKLYLGHEVTLDELGVADKVRRETFELREVGARKINCPNCGGALDLHAPDRTERVGCPYCGSLLDATQGNLTLLKALKEPPFELLIPLGSKGTFGTDERTIIGALKRCVFSEGVEYPWFEYLLYHPRDGFEWLICSNNHWTRAKGIPAADVIEKTRIAYYEGDTFKAFQSGTAIVRGVIGECYWKVAVKEKADTIDYIHPPLMLSCETSRSGAKEINWTLGSYLTPAEVQTAFGMSESLPTPEGIAPNQPFPYKRIYKFALWFFLALCLLGLVSAVVRPSRKVYESTFQLRALGTPAAPAAGAPAPQPPAPPAAPEKTQIFFSDHFELKGHRNVKVSVSAPQLTGWLVVEGDLVQQSNGTVQPFLVPLTHYSGVEDGEAWSEGSKSESTFVSAQPAGQYSLRLEVERENSQTTGPLTVRVEEGAHHIENWMLTLLGIGLIPLCIGIYHLTFTSRRWQNSDFSMFSTDDFDSGGEQSSSNDPLAAPVAETTVGETGRPVARPVNERRKNRKKGRKGRD